jgi:phenylalanyl-tRNA synthetase beta chain
VVDATNYAMLETGQPPHAFDYAKINEGKIIVRRALAGERIVSIDGARCELEPQMLIIADPKGPVAIAGVMGGLATQVSEGSTSILLEDAFFDPVSVRRTSRRLGLCSEAAFRFERIVDIDRIDWASQRTAQLIVQVGGGKVARGVVDAYRRREEPKRLALRLSRLNCRLGIEVPAEVVVRILSALCFQPRLENGTVACTIPSWRSDVYREVDLIEEVARLYGYDRIPSGRKIEIEVVPVDARQKIAQAVGTYLNGCGFYETVTISFVDDSVAKLFTGVDASKHLGVRDASRKSANLLRRTLLGSLLGVLKTNVNVGNLPCRIYEIADVYVPTNSPAENLPAEQTHLALVCDSDFRDLRGVIEGLIKNMGRDADVVFRPSTLVWAEAGAEVMVNGEIVGIAGVVSEAVKRKFDLKEITPCAAELGLSEVSALCKEARQLKPIPRFPAIDRDLSIIVDEGTTWADIREAVTKKAPSELEEIRFVDIYRGRGIASGKKSVTLSLRFRDEDGTLTHDAVDAVQATIVGSLAECVKAELRTVQSGLSHERF